MTSRWLDLPEKRSHSPRAYAAILAAVHSERDFAEWLTEIVAAVTARVGGIEQLLAGRPDSTEARVIRSWMELIEDRPDGAKPFRTYARALDDAAEQLAEGGGES